MNDYERIAAVIRFLAEHHTEQPDLATLAGQVGLSESHFHRLFSRWAGITPKDFLQCLTLSHVKALLAQGRDVLNAALDAGLSGPGRLHDLCVNLEAASPGELKSGGARWTIRAGFAETPFGKSLIGESPRGICYFSFVDSPDRQAGGEAIQRQWPRSQIVWDDGSTREFANTLFQRPPETASNGSAPLAVRAFVRGTNFQVRVWRALLQIPAGTLVTYGDLAVMLGQPSASRAVGAAIGQNSLAYLIPCHRVIRSTGVIGDYRWDAPRKKALLVWETAAASHSESDSR